MIKAQLTYSDGAQTIREFKDENELNWFKFNEGDHLVKCELIILAEMSPDVSKMLID